MFSDRPDEEFSEGDFLRRFNEPQHSYVQAEKFSSGYYKDPTEESSQINRAFRANNYTYLRQLPAGFAHNKILEQRLDRAKQHLEEERAQMGKTHDQKLREHGEAVRSKKMEQIGSMGYFEAFTYEGSSYDFAKEKLREERMESDKKRRELSDLDFRPADTEYKAKYEDPFAYRDRATPNARLAEGYLFPFSIPT